MLVKQKTGELTNAENGGQTADQKTTISSLHSKYGDLSSHLFSFHLLNVRLLHLGQLWVGRFWLDLVGHFGLNWIRFRRVFSVKSEFASVLLAGRKSRYQYQNKLFFRSTCTADFV